MITSPPPGRRWATPARGIGDAAEARATYRLIRYADDFVIVVHGTQAHAEALRDQAAAVLAPMGLRLSVAKTRICHIDQGFDFLGATRGRTARVGNVDWRAVMTAT